MDLLFRLIDLNGVATRGQAWAAFMVLIVIGVALGVLQELARPEARFLFPVLGLVFVVFLCTMVRRLHDMGHSGYWALTLLIPVVSIVTTLVCLLRRSRRRYVDNHPVAQGLATLGLAAILALFCLRMIWQPFWIPSESMKPTLLIGDYLVVNMARADDVRRGDVVVFRHPVNGVDHIARLIGLPGDTVQMQGGMVVLNGQPLGQVADGQFEEVMAPQGPLALRPRCENGPVGEGGLCTKSRFIESLPGADPYRVLSIETGGHGDTTEVFTVPAGHLFFLGDNRDNSVDSRYSQAVGGMGMVPADAVIGRADRILFSAAGQRLFHVWTWRAGRAFGLVE